jgi:hypothetical protein
MGGGLGPPPLNKGMIYCTGISMIDVFCTLIHAQIISAQKNSAQFISAQIAIAQMAIAQAL